MIRFAKAVLVAVMTVSMAGCVLSGQPKTVASAPAPPQNPAPPPAPREPLSIPQTDVDLPTPQTFSQDALNTTPPEPAPQPQSKPPAQPRQQNAPRPTVPQTKPPEPQPPQVVDQPATPEPERPKLVEILPPDEQNRLKDSAHSNQAETRKLLSNAKLHTANQRRAAAEINQFLKQSEQAENTGDYRLANQLAERANLLAKELQSGK